MAYITAFFVNWGGRGPSVKCLTSVHVHVHIHEHVHVCNVYVHVNIHEYYTCMCHCHTVLSLHVGVHTHTHPHTLTCTHPLADGRVLKAVFGTNTRSSSSSILPSSLWWPRRYRYTHNCSYPVWL